MWIGYDAVILCLIVVQSRGNPDEFKNCGCCATGRSYKCRVGDYCNYGCLDGYWGKKCDNKCRDTNCARCIGTRGQSCQECQTGYYGFNCGNRCGSQCKTCQQWAGCTECHPGYYLKDVLHSALLVRMVVLEIIVSIFVTKTAFTVMVCQRMPLVSAISNVSKINAILQRKDVFKDVSMDIGTKHVTESVNQNVYLAIKQMDRVQNARTVQNMDLNVDMSAAIHVYDQNVAFMENVQMDVLQIRLKSDVKTHANFIVNLRRITLFVFKKRECA
ncbi:hypothetical protein MAR_031284 [Mya arenaria]|uniref:Scavenger receptor class F member 2 n=1 Tax=Mya arenaria TaxID=6604 RepID=A0ABY7F4K3_MYAAR|nr:hypothetical protein MAR_031284 [Mya arenaria]